MTASEEEQQQLHQQHNQEPKVTITSLDQVVEESKRCDNRIDPYALLSGFVAYLQEEKGIEDPNTIRHFVITARTRCLYSKGAPFQAGYASDR